MFTQQHSNSQLAAACAYRTLELTQGFLQALYERGTPCPAIIHSSIECARLGLPLHLTGEPHVTHNPQAPVGMQVHGVRVPRSPSVGPVRTCGLASSASELLEARCDIDAFPLVYVASVSVQQVH